jgi:uncharacterized protein
VKLLVWLLIALLVAWRWRSKAQPPKSAARPHAQPEAAGTVDMLACPHCGLHLPAADMVVGAQGRYCSAAHRDLAEH